MHETSIEAALGILNTGLICGGHYPARRYEAYPHFYLEGERISRGIPGHPHEVTLFFESDMPLTHSKAELGTSANVAPGSIVKVYSSRKIYSTCDEPKEHTEFWQAVIAPGSPAIRFVGYEIANGFNCQIRHSRAFTKAAWKRRKVHVSFITDQLLPGRSNGFIRRLALHLTRTWAVSEDWPRAPALVNRPLAWLTGRWTPAFVYRTRAWLSDRSRPYARL
jgi:hypothetical protein